MCGIFAIFRKEQAQDVRAKAVRLSKKLRHRGPDWSGVVVVNDTILCHERLSIVGVDSGAQPLLNEDESIFLAVNGEIYNHMSLRKYLKGDHVFRTKSDCEIILHLWEEMGPDLVNLLDGMFSFVLYDSKKDLLFAARDHVGITTLYYGHGKDDSVWFASEMKALNEDCTVIKAFPPGSTFLGSGRDPKTDKWKVYYSPAWYEKVPVPEAQAMSVDEETLMYTNIRTALEISVQKRLMAEVPYGVLLSGGLDSSLIAAIAARHMQRAIGFDEDIRNSLSLAMSFPKLHSFSIGLPGSPDLEAAEKVAKYLKTVHHSFTFSINEGLDAIEDVIYHLETYDVTTVRASTPMYLLSRKIKAMGVKMVLSGEGSDEIFGGILFLYQSNLTGYLYFHSAPTAEALHHECIDRIKNLHTSDCLRANKSTMAWGLEARVPFLDKKFLDVAMTIPPSTKTYRSPPYNHKMEKYVLRKAFDTPTDPYLPDEILWRQKEQFSDGVGYSWIDSVRNYADEKISDSLMSQASTLYPVDTPTTKEAFLYRQIFCSLFPQAACLESVVRWIPRADWGCPSDPSGRAQKSHLAAYKT